MNPTFSPTFGPAGGSGFGAGGGGAGGTEGSGAGAGVFRRGGVVFWCGDSTTRWFVAGMVSGGNGVTPGAGAEMTTMGSCGCAGAGAGTGGAAAVSSG